MSHFMRPQKQIDEGLAQSLAGQVSAGLIPGEGQFERMEGALVAIGLMIRNASGSDAVQNQLDLIDKSEVTKHGAGFIEIVTHPESPDSPS